MSPASDSTLADPQQIVADLRRELAEARRKLDECTAERNEAMEQQTATAEVLGVINASPGDLAPVFDAMLEKARTLCDPSFGILWTYDRERAHAAALHGVPSAAVSFFTKGPHEVSGTGNGLGLLLCGEDLVHVRDVAATELYQSGDDPLRRALVERREGSCSWTRAHARSGCLMMYPAPLKPPISFDQLNAVEIRVGTIISVRDIPRSEKLVPLRVNFGDQERTIVAGFEEGAH